MNLEQTSRIYLLRDSLYLVEALIKVTKLKFPRIVLVYSLEGYWARASSEWVTLKMINKAQS